MGILIDLRHWKREHEAQVEAKAQRRDREVRRGLNPGWYTSDRPQVIPLPSKATEPMSKVPRDAGAMTSWTGRRAWHSVEEPVHHDNTKCDRGSKIPQSTRVAGTGNKPFCRNCATLHRETKVTTQTRVDKYQATLYEVLVGGQIRWRRRVPRHHKLGDWSKAAREQDRAVARLTAAVRARTELKATDAGRT